MIHLKRTQTYYLNSDLVYIELFRQNRRISHHFRVCKGTQNRTKIFEPNKDKRSSNIKFHENPSNGSRAVPCGRTDMKLIVAFRTFAKAPKNARNRKQVRCTIISRETKRPTKLFRNTYKQFSFPKVPIKDFRRKLGDQNLNQSGICQLPYRTCCLFCVEQNVIQSVTHTRAKDITYMEMYGWMETPGFQIVNLRIYW